MILHLVAGGFLSQPSWWQNFINDVDDRFPYAFHYYDEEERDQLIKNEFAKVGAILIDDEDEDSILGVEFKDDAMASWFLLRFS
jgi:hypothetical protein